MKINNILPFVQVIASKHIGLAQEGTFAANAWMISDELFDQTMGRKFSWRGPDGEPYIDDRDGFIRPTQQAIIENMTPEIKRIALQRGYITEDDDHRTGSV